MFKELNEELERILNEADDILGIPVKEYTNKGMALGDSEYVVPKGFYKGIKDASRSGGGLTNFTVVPNGLYYSSGSAYDGVYKFNVTENQWIICLARSIDFNKNIYKKSYDIFMDATKKITEKEAKEFIKSNEINDRPTFGDSKIVVGDKVKTKDGLKGEVIKRYHDFAGQLFYKIKLEDGTEKKVFFTKVGLLDK